MENNKLIFKISREQYGDNSVSYRGIELQATNRLDRGSSLSFEWGDTSHGSEALAYEILEKIGSRDIASRYAKTYMKDIISKIAKDEWILEGIFVVRWINLHTNYSIDEVAFSKGNTTYEYKERRKEDRRQEERRIKREREFQEEAQKRLKIYEAKLDKRQEEERQKEERRIQREKDFKEEAQKRLKIYEEKEKEKENNRIKEIHAKHQEELNTYKKHIIKQNADIEVYKKDLQNYKDFVDSIEVKALYEKYSQGN